MIKWIISDMDGTLLDDSGNLPQDFDEIMEELDKRNIIFSPASGRQYYALAKQFEKYKDKWLFIAENGTMVVKGGKLLSYVALPDTLTGELIKAASSIEGTFPVVCTCEGSYITEENDELLAQLSKYYTQYTLIDSFDEIKKPIIKISVCDCKEKNAKENVLKHLEVYSNFVHVVMATNVWVDVMSKEVNKGVAISAIQKKMGIKPEECMAFGDYFNDWEMLQVVGESYAMENAAPDIKKIAKHIAPSNNQAGVITVIRKMLAQSQE